MQHQPVILYIETATEICSVCLARGSEIMAIHETVEPYKHGELLTVMIQQCFGDSGLVMQELEAVTISNGPGSYTGLRIGLSVAKGLCYALNIPLIQVSTLQAVAQGILHAINDDNTLLCAMIDARRMEVYTSVFNTQLEEVTSARSWIIEPALYFEHDPSVNVHFGGSGAEKASTVLAGNNFYFQDVTSSARLLVNLGLRKYYGEVFENIAYAKPFYFKPPNITKSRKKT